MSTAEGTSVVVPLSDVTTVAVDKLSPTPPSTSKQIAALFIVLAVAFASSTMTSVLRVFGVHIDYPDTLIGYRYFFTLVHELIALAVLAYVVWPNRLARLGAIFQMTDVAYGVLLWIVAECCYRLAFPTILSISERVGWHKAPPYYPSTHLSLVLITYCFVAINPVYEEMIVRAFLISETAALTGSSAIAVLFSVLLQTSYHLYQGVPYALALGVVFLIFSIYYVRTHRIWPIVIAHFIMDLSFVLISRPV
ncbi:MAG TPA: CPBP family intramembrane glutamic endopeptidase [Terriglobales bacterium]